jgi:hypothetical protein
VLDDLLQRNDGREHARRRRGALGLRPHTSRQVKEASRVSQRPKKADLGSGFQHGSGETGFGATGGQGSNNGEAGVAFAGAVAPVRGASANVGVRVRSRASERADVRVQARGARRRKQRTLWRGWGGQK